MASIRLELSILFVSARHDLLLTLIQRNWVLCEAYLDHVLPPSLHLLPIGDYDDKLSFSPLVSKTISWASWGQVGNSASRFDRW
mmetsp:Transcript_2459/g.7185  ORF Transcript_2459/g.7185 Transcript_2459/m.7185 type:complete len:84 (+) Transcript_2459:1386-1637(+)